ncbi:MAG: SDR family oxidoreductase [Woeseiaceae bacterium]|nr:SDR family oxidoreductase [Woeseiaceae bacterium]
MTNPANKTVLITGAGGGFGIEMVRQFRAAGAKLLLTDISDAALAHAIDDAGNRLVGCLATDLATTEGCDAIAELCAANDAPDILVNNAGIAVAGRVDHVPQERWETLMQLNLLAPMRLSSALIPGMIERGGGHIVNISSVAGWIGAQGLSSYCASKFGLRGYGDSLAYELDGTGVRVTTVFPCFSRTPILDSPQYGYEERREVPEYLVSEPADVVRRVVKGVRRNRRYVYPDKYARLIQYITRVTPWALPYIDKRLDAQSIAEGNQSD